MSQQPIDFYFEFASPYAYLAADRLEALAAAHGRAVTWRPIMLGAAFKRTGMRPTVHQPMRREYLLRDVARFARLLGLPFTEPAVMPVNSLAAGRAYYWAAETDPDLAGRLARALLGAHWAEGRDIGPPEAVAEVARGLGIDGARLLEAVADPRIKQRLRDETEAAIERGVFGSPFVVVDGEPFWGADRLDQVENWLKGGW
jgi:2-hydroxychromene-2-carboxylate isomerase